MAQYSDEFRAEVIAAAKRSDKSTSAVAREYGISPSTLSRWTQQGDMTNTGADEDEEYPKVGQIRIRSKDGTWKEIYAERREIDDPEIEALWAMSYENLIAVNKDPDHPLHEKSKQVSHEIMAPFAKAVTDAYQPIADSMKSSVRELAQTYDQTPSWIRGLSKQFVPEIKLKPFGFMETVAEQKDISRAIAEIARPQLPKLDIMPTLNLAWPTSDLSMQSMLSGLQPQLDNIFAWHTKQIRETTKGMRWALLLVQYPPNWHHDDVYPVGGEALRPILWDDGIALAWAPDTETLIQLLNAEGPEHRHQVISERREIITKHCQALLEDEVEGELSEIAVASLEATELILDGKYRGGQALATNALEAALRLHFGKRYGNALNRNGRSAFTNKKLTFATAMVMEAVIAAYEGQAQPHLHPIPRKYGRNVTAHSVSPRQYTPTNAVLALMHATSAIMLFAKERKAERAEALKERLNGV